MQLTIDREMADVFRFFIEDKTEILKFIKTKRELRSDEVSAPNKDIFIAIPNSVNRNIEVRDAKTRLNEYAPPEGTAADGETRRDIGSQVSRKRRATQSDKLQGQEPQDERHAPPMPTVVLEPMCRENVTKFNGREIQKAIEMVAISIPEGVSVHVHPKINTIALTTKNTLTMGKLLDIKEFRELMERRRKYRALSTDRCGGVVYLREKNQRTSDALLSEIDCRTHTKQSPPERLGRTELPFP